MEKIDIMELARQYPELMISVRASDLAEFGSRLILEAKRVAELAKDSSMDTERLITPREVMDRLKVSDTTLWRMEQDHELSPVFVRGQKRYRFSEIMSIIKR